MLEGRGLLIALAVSLAVHWAAVRLWTAPQAASGLPGAPLRVLAPYPSTPAPAAAIQAAVEPLPAAPLRPERAGALPSSHAALPPEAQAPAAATPAEPRDTPTGTDALPPVSQPGEEAAVANPPGAPAAPDAPRGFGAVEYWPARLLDAPSQPLSPIELPTPAATPEGGARLELLVYVAADGSVDAVEVVSASPPGVLEAVALDVFGRARFEPGIKGGIAVRHYKRIAVGMSM